MKWITVATPPVKTIEQFDQVVSRFGEAPEGLETRYVGSDGGKLRVVSLWSSKSHADKFFAEKLGPALASVLGPEPVGLAEVIGIEVERSFVSEPVG